MSDLIQDPDLTPDDIHELRHRALKRNPSAKAKRGTISLARSIGVTPVTVTKWLNGTTAPSEYRTAQLINEFGAPSRFNDHDGVATYIHDGDTVTLGFTFIGDADAVNDAVLTVRDEVTA